jgi:mRNA-degrading endonuclease RelE of RelBE toxin-antitoxin system
MNKIEKILAKVDSKERDSILELMYKIKSGNLQGLNIKKLEGKSECFRLKKGNFRIIFSKTDTGIEIISVDRRNEKTYRNY